MALTTNLRPYQVTDEVVTSVQGREYVDELRFKHGDEV